MVFICCDLQEQEAKVDDNQTSAEELDDSSDDDFWISNSLISLTWLTPSFMKEQNGLCQPCV